MVSAARFAYPIGAVGARASADTRTGGSEATTESNGGTTVDRAVHRRAAHILERALSHTGGTVTALLETMTGEVIEAEVIEQAALLATIPNRLDVGAGHPLVRRQAILRGRTSRRGYLYAETVFVPDRLPEGVAQVLETTTARLGACSPSAASR